MNPDDFEKRLRRQPFQKIPGKWRAEILKQASAARPARSGNWLSFISTVLWPNPKAWAAVCAVWVVIFALQFAARDRAPQVARSSEPEASENVARLREQQRMLAELIGDDAAQKTIKKPAAHPAQPRSERSEAQSMI